MAAVPEQHLGTAKGAMLKLKTHLTSLVDPVTTDEFKLKGAQEVSENLETIVSSQHYSSFLETAVPIFLQLLKEGEPKFLTESPSQQLRKLVLELIHRLPANDHLKGHVKTLLSTMFSLLEIENEENVLVCLKVIIELHKQFRPSYSTEITKFLQFVKTIYNDLPKTMSTALETQEGDAVEAPSAMSAGGGATGGGATVGGAEASKSSGILPKASSSLKVLAELPIIVVLMYQLYKQTVHQWVADLIPLTIKTIILQPTEKARASPKFNKEVYVDFVAVQIKFLSFVAYIIRIYQDQVNHFAPGMVQGMLALLRNCPQEVAHLRRELLVAARHILATDLRNRFVPCIDQLFDENLLVGSGWTTKETVRSLAYSILADLVHHIRTSLSLPQLSQAVHVFSKNVHDESFPVSIQTMSCKLLLNLVECIRQKGEQDPSSRDLFMRMMEVFVLKFHSISEYQIPELLEKCHSQSELGLELNGGSNGTNGGSAGSDSGRKMSVGGSHGNASLSLGPSNGNNNGGQSTGNSVPDCRGMVKTLVCGMKTITWGAGSCKLPGSAIDYSAQPQKMFLPHESEVFVRLLKFGLVALDIYRITVLPNGTHVLRNANCQTVKTKEEKEVLEHFAGVFTMLQTDIFKEIFSDTIEYLVERVQSNYALQIIPNSFLANVTTSATFAGILLEFLLKRMEELGASTDKSNLYLKMFKLVFGSVTLFPQENELMLKPHLHEIVNRSMSFANTCKEPCNYFLLLRALFRSIGGGSHELLYQEFLPLLSNLLQGLNRLQSANHRQYMKDLFVELCLTVPVRLSSLLPYLHLLMDPLVSALNGSQTLVSQGLRTLELCVDNLQPDFLYEHIQPVRAQLMQALWQTLHNQDDGIAQVAFRVLGKFGGSNRKMLTSPQQLDYVDTLAESPAILIGFPDTEHPIELPVAKVVETAVKQLKAHTTELHHRQQAWWLIQSYLVSSLNLTDADADLYQLLKQVHYQPVEFNATRLKHISLPQCTNKVARNTFETALNGVFIASCLRDLRNEAVVFLAGMVRHITSVAVIQQSSSSSFLKQLSQDTMDVYILLDALAKCVGSEERELCRIAELALTFILDTATTITGDKERACELPLFEVAVDKMCGCCYERAWYSKSGGCWAISFFLEKMPLKWIINHQLTFLMALLFVLHDLSNEVSSGTTLQAQKLIEKMLKMCNSELSPETKANLEPLQLKAFTAVTRHIVKEIITPNEAVRKQAHSSLMLLGEVTGKTISCIIEPHKELLTDMIPPKKHLLKHQPMSTQIALMDGYTFCCNLEPRLFSITLTVPEHKIFFQELITLCEGEDAVLSKFPCYKGIPSLLPLKASGLAALAASTYLTEMREKIFNVLYKAINCPSTELQKAGKEGMSKFMADTSQSDIELVHSALRPLLMMLGDFRNLNPTLLQRLMHMVELFPTSFNEKMCESLLAHLRRWVDVLVTTVTAKAQRKGDEVQICLLILEMFHMLPASTFKLFEPLLVLCVKAEKALSIELCSQFRDPLFKFGIKFPTQMLDFFLQRLFDPIITRIFHSFLHKESSVLKDALSSNCQKLIASTFAMTTQQTPLTEESLLQRKIEVQYQGISLCHFLVEQDEKWIVDKATLVDYLKSIWNSNTYHSQMSWNSLPLSRWQECSMLLKCLLTHCKLHREDIATLFQLLKAFLHRHITSFPFLKSYLDNTVAKEYTIEQKRTVFFKFVEIFSQQDYSQELKAKILQHILIPIFTASFEEDLTDELLGGPPDPEKDSDTNIISIFINRIINPDQPFGNSDSVCILLLQLSSLIVEHAAPHIHDSNNKKQGAKLRRLMTFAWPCLLPKQCVDPATKYHGHLLLAHIIAKFAIHKRIVLQVFHSLLKAHAIEARPIVRQALNILTPVVPVRMEDANATLVHWTKKIIVEEGQTVAQLVHILQLLCHHYKVYYPVRQHLVQHMVSSMQRLGLTSNATIEQRKLAVDLSEVIVKWEFQRARDAQEDGDEPMEIVKEPSQSVTLGMKRSSSDGTLQGGGSSNGVKRQKSQPQVADPSWPLDKQHADAIINFLVRLACQVNDAQSSSVPGSLPSSGEALSKRCVSLIRTALKPDLWPSIDVKLSWFGKLLETLSQVDPVTATPTQSVYASVCTALEILTFLFLVLPRAAILSGFKSLNRGLQQCMTCNNIKVIRFLHTLLIRLMTMFPTEPASAHIASKHEELEPIYSIIHRSIIEGLNSYEKATSSSTTGLQCTLLILRAACNNDPTYIDRCLVPFVKVMQKLHKEHVLSTSASTAEANSVSELLQLSLDLSKLRVSMMPQECRKVYFNILTSLIEKSSDAKLLKTLTRIIDEWLRNRYDLPSHSGPTLREKSLLLSRMMTSYEKRFPDDIELLVLFLDIVLFVYKDDQLCATELTAKLEPAFLCGLRCSQVHVRSKFFEVFENSIQKRLYDRLLYILCSQNWEHCGGHYWIKQCIELVLSVGILDLPIRAAPSSPVLPCVSSIIPSSTPLVPDVTEPPTITSQLPEELMEGVESEGNGIGALEKLANKLTGFLSDCMTVQSRQFVSAAASLCHENTLLAHSMWVDMFPRIWRALSERQRMALSGELSPFMCSASHLIQMDCHPSAVGTFLEAVLKCRPTPHIKSCLLKYLGKTHNYWHGAVLLLEERATQEGELSLEGWTPPPYDGNYSDEILDPLKHETVDSLAEMYSLLNEEDMWAGTWLMRSHFPETRVAIAFESQGVFDLAQDRYEKAMKRARDLHNIGPAPPSVITEYKLWEEHWSRCARELGQWDTLNDFGKSHGGTNPFLVLENAWRVQDWSAMREASTQAEPICSESYSAKLNLLRGFLALCYPDEQRLSAVEKLVEAASIQSVKQWRRLPHIVSHSHIPLLQLSQQIIELQEATQIHTGMQSGSLNRQPFINEVKTIFKTWKNRLPNHFDDLSYWSDVLLWREQHFRTIIKAYDGTSHAEQSNQGMIAVHHLASGITQFASIARKQKLPTVSLEALSRIHSIPSVPVVDLFQKIRQQVKCYLMTANNMEPGELQEALEFIESTNLKYFGKEMVSEFMSLKGTFQAQIGKSEEANKSFSAAVQLHDGLVKAWALWGDFLDQLFIEDKNLTLGVAALTCHLHACRHQSETKSRKYLARAIWMLTYDDEKGTLAEALDKYYMGIPPMHWLPWIPQLLTCLVRSEGTHVLNLLCSVGKQYPQAVYFPIRTLYLTLKLEQKEKFKSESHTAPLLSRSTSQTSTTDPPSIPPSDGVVSMETEPPERKPSLPGTPGTDPKKLPPITPTSSSGIPQLSSESSLPSESAPIRAPASLWRCSRIMHLLRDLHPTLLSALEGIVDQLVWFRESWYEDLLRQLNEGLSICYAEAYKNRTDVGGTKITPEMLQYVQRLVRSFGISVDGGSTTATGSGNNNGSSALGQEALTKRAQAAAQDPAFQRLKNQFVTDFDFSAPGPKKLPVLITKLKRWIKILELKTKSLQKSFLLEDRCRFLSNFSLSTADVEMPGEHLELQIMPYCVRIARFMPRVEIVQRHNTTVRRLHIQGDNGKIYPYIVLNEPRASECRQQERVLQLFRLINHCLKKEKETCKRHLMFTVPKVVALSPQQRLLEDDLSIVSLADVFKQYCSGRSLEWDTLITQYYDKLGSLQARGDKITLTTLKSMFAMIQGSQAPVTILRSWGEKICGTLTDFWTLRKQMTRQLSLCGLAEFIFHLTRLDPEMLQITRGSGCLSQTFYKFEINKEGALDANRPVPFRLTPSIQNFLTPVGITGPLYMSMVALARVLVQPQYNIESILAALFRDEFIAWCKQKQEETEGHYVSLGDVSNDVVIPYVTAAVDASMTRLFNVAEFEAGKSQVSTLIQAARNPDNIARMDPVWNPWL